MLKGEQKTAAYLKRNPLGVVPFLDAGQGVGLGESNAMLWFLAENTHLMPTSPEERAEALQWMFFEQSKLEPFISPARFFSFIRPEQRSERAEDIAYWQNQARPGLERLNAHLATRQFILASGYSIADIALFGYGHVMDEAGLDAAAYPMIQRWIEDVQQTKGFQPLQNMGEAEARAA